MVRLSTIVGFLLASVFASGCGGPSKITKENFDKIKNDMTQKQVEDILGEGTQTAGGGENVAGQFGIDVGTSSGPSSVEYTWEKGPKVIKVTFKKGKVASKTSSGL
jgi:hypothetical protein